MKNKTVGLDESELNARGDHVSPSSGQDQRSENPPTLVMGSVNEYDKIRAMSDSEMKDWISSLWDVASHMGMLRANEIQEAAKKVADETMKRREEYMSKTAKLFLDDDMEEWMDG